MYLFATCDIWTFMVRRYYSKCDILLLSIPTQQRMAQEVLTHLKEHPDAWTRVDTILEFSQNMNTKVSGLGLTRHWCRGAGTAAVDIPSFTTFEGTPVGCVWSRTGPI